MSTPAEDAERMGLERKPGFGNYGLPGSDDVTHRSRGGKLVPVADTQGTGVGRGAGKAVPKGGTGAPKKVTPPPSTPRPTPTPTVKPKTPPKVVPVQDPPVKPRGNGWSNRADEYKKRADEKGGARVLAKFLDDVPRPPARDAAKDIFEKAERSARGMLNAARAAMGADPRDVVMYASYNDPIPQHFMRHELLANQGQPVADGLHNALTRDIWIAPYYRKQLDAIVNTPYPLWTQDQTTGAHIVIHESIHSTSPRLAPNAFIELDTFFGPVRGLEVLASPDGLQMEEGMTEFLARGIRRTGLIAAGVAKEHNEDKNFRAYSDWVNGVRWLATYGGLDVENTFKTATASQTRETFWKAEDQLMKDVLARELGFTDEEVARVIEGIHEYEKRSEPHSKKGWAGTVVTHRKFALFNPAFYQFFKNSVKEARKGNYDGFLRFGNPAEQLLYTLML